LEFLTKSNNTTAQRRVLNPPHPPPPRPAVHRCGLSLMAENRRFATTGTSTRASGEFGASRFDVSRGWNEDPLIGETRGVKIRGIASGINKLERIYATRRVPMTETDWGSCGRSGRELR